MGRTGFAKGLPFPIGLTALALFAVLIGRGLAFALPGTFSGISEQIAWVELLAAYLSQLSALSFGVVSARMMLQVLLGSSESMVKALAALAVVASIAVVYVSSGTAYRLAHVWLLGMGACILGFAFGVGVRALFKPRYRGAGLVVVAVTFAGAAHLLARWVALGAEEGSLPSYTLAQAFATAGFVFEALAISGALVWLLSGSRARDDARKDRKLLGVDSLVVLRSAVLVCAAAVLALAFAVEEDSGWRLLLSRTLSALATYPDPLLPARLSNLLEMLGFLACAACLIPSQRSPQQRASVALALLARASFDVPLGGLFAVSAALTLLVVVQWPLAEPVSAGPAGG